MLETTEEIAQQTAQIEAWLSLWSQILNDKEGIHEASEQQSKTND